MSKKKFKKFKKKKKHGQHSYSGYAPVQEPQVREPVQVQQSTAATSIPIQTPVEPEKTEATESKKEVAEEIAANNKEYAYVKRDVKKILIVMGSIIALLIVAFYVNEKTPIFHSMGNWLYNALNIQTQ